MSFSVFLVCLVVLVVQTSSHIPPPFVAMWLCGHSSVTFGYVLVWLCGYVAVIHYKSIH